MGSISHGGHERGKRGDGDLTRARILESAGQLAAECGYANMTSKQVCERAHVNMAAVKPSRQPRRTVCGRAGRGP